MKNWILMILCMGLLLSGCEAPEKVSEVTANAEETVTETSAVPETETTEKMPEAVSVPEASYLSVRYTQDRIETFDKETGKIKLLNFDFPWLEVTVSGNSEASAKISTALREENSKFIKGISAEGDLYTPMGQEQAAIYAQEKYTEFGESFLPYAVERKYEIIGGNENLLSIRIWDYAYLGGAHGSLMQKYLVFDTNTGELLTFGDMTDGPNGLWAVLVEKMQEIVKQDSDISSRMDFVEAGDVYTAVAGLIREGSWYIEDDCFCLESQEYELGSYAAGIIQFKIPMEELREHIKPQYMPEALQTGSVTLTDETDLLAVDLLQLGENPADLYLEARGTVKSLRIFTLEPYENGEDVHEGHTLWHGRNLKDCAVELLVDMPGLMPNLGAEFYGEDGVLKSCALLQSGEDGHFFLTEWNQN